MQADRVVRSWWAATRTLIRDRNIRRTVRVASDGALVYTYVAVTARRAPAGSGNSDKSSQLLTDSIESIDNVSVTPRYASVATITTATPRQSPRPETEPTDNVHTVRRTFTMKI